MIELRPRETILLATNFSRLVSWYQAALGFVATRSFDEDYHYCNLETSTGIRLGIVDAQKMGLATLNQANNSVVLQFEVDDLREFFAHLERAGATITGSPKRDEQHGFWFGSFADPEGNPFWVVDKHCP